jgi:hypothetical protein
MSRALHTCCISSHLCPQNSNPAVHPSGSQNNGRFRVLKWDYRGNEGEQIKGADFCT